MVREEKRDKILNILRRDKLFEYRGITAIRLTDEIMEAIGDE